jgi:prepilin-type N-terminal cleavage/methylation domain-containing protein
MQLKATSRAFTLIELLVVIAVAGILAALAVPAIKEFGRSNQQVAATRQLLDDVGRARQLAIANRTTVYMVFLPDGFLAQAPFASLSKQDQQLALQLAPAQGRAYALMSLRSIGDQPGQNRPQYLTEWKTLPRGWLIAPSKFSQRAMAVQYTNYVGGNLFRIFGFNRTVQPPDPVVPLYFPSVDAPLQPGGATWILPYIAFDPTGKLTSGEDEYIPLARGTVDPAVDPNTGAFVPGVATITESPPANSLTDYNVIHIDWLTGRAKLETRQIE